MCGSEGAGPRAAHWWRFKMYVERRKSPRRGPGAADSARVALLSDVIVARETPHVKPPSDTLKALAYPLWWKLRRHFLLAQAAAYKGGVQ